MNDTSNKTAPDIRQDYGAAEPNSSNVIVTQADENTSKNLDSSKESGIGRVSKLLDAITNKQTSDGRFVSQTFVFGEFASPEEPPELISGTERQATQQLYQYWNECLETVDAQHPYLDYKKIKAYGIRQDGDNLVIPLYNENGDLCSVQKITVAGNKAFWRNVRNKGRYFMIGQPINDEITVCSSYSTGATIHEATGQCVVVCFGRDNIQNALPKIKSVYQTANITIAADNDEREGHLDNIGIDTARKLQEIYGCSIVIPRLNGGGSCDFSDVGRIDGLERVKELCAQKETLKSKYIDKLPEGFFLTNDYLKYTEKTKKGNNIITVSARIEVKALIRDRNSDNWAKLVSFKDPDGNKKEIIFSSALLSNDGKEIRETLWKAGLNIEPEGRYLLLQYLSKSEPSKRIYSVKQTGWDGDTVFVFPNQIIGHSADELRFTNDVAFDSLEVKGTSADWKDTVGHYCRGNTRLVFGVSCSFASMLLKRLDMPNFGFHLVGPSSCGKSTILSVASSVFGSKSFVRSWRTTDNGLEMIAFLRNDMLLTLDEMGQADPGKVGEIAYMLGNGQGKTRATKSGTTKPALSWRLLFLSSGETDLEAMTTLSRKKVKAGQTLRLLNVPARVQNGQYGAFENIHAEETPAAFVQRLKQFTNEAHGAVAIDFINAVISDTDDINNSFKVFRAKFCEKAKDLDPQIQRACDYYAFVAFAGEYATQKGLTGWEIGESTRTAEQMFEEWLAYRGSKESYEKQELLKHVRYFFETHQNSHFVEFGQESSHKGEIYGYKDERTYNDEEVCFWVLAEVMQEKVCPGIDFQYAKDILTKEGWLLQSHSVSKRINNKPTKVYEFTHLMFS